MTRIGLPRFASFLTRTTKEETDALGEDPRREPRRARLASRSDPEGKAAAQAGAAGDAGADPEAGPLKRVRRGAGITTGAGASGGGGTSTVARKGEGDTARLLRLPRAEA